MNLLEDKIESLLEEISYFEVLAKEYQMNSLIERFRELYSDIVQDHYSFIVVGEFSTGKSSFLNALIEQPILPTGITPTTSTINIIRYGEEFKVTVMYSDGTERINYNTAVLNEFIAKELDHAEHINQIEVIQPIEFLKERIILVDTPGLNDINELRSDITYQYIPRADVVFFLLDCRSPLRYTEYDFIANTLLANGLDKIIFIANFADQVDEDELEEIVEKMRRDIMKGTSMKEVDIIPFSALEALEAISEKDAELYEISGMPLAREKMHRLCASGSRIQEKKKRYNNRLYFLKQEFYFLLEQKQFMLEQSGEQLEQYQVQLQQWYDDQKIFIDKLRKYKDERVYEFQQMAKTSIKTFFNDLEEEVHERIDVYSNNHIQTFFEKEIPNQIKRRMKNWIERYNPHIHELIGKLEVALGEILSQLFNEKISINAMRGQYQITSAKEVKLDSGEQVDPLLTSGLIVGGASTLLLVLGGPILLPILGMAGLPYLQRTMLKKQLDILKPQMKIDVSANLLQAQFQFIDEVCDYIQVAADKVFEQSLLNFQNRIVEQESLVKDQVEKNMEESTENEKEIMKIKNILIERQLLKV